MSKWTKLSAEKPLDGQCVDVWGSVVGGYNHGDEGRIENCFYCDVRGWWKWDENCDEQIIIEGFNVTHWMPIPEPPND